MKLFFKALGVMGLVFLAGCGKQEDANTIKIGEYGSLTGGSATFGQSTHKGIMLATEELNEAGGLLGKKVKILTEDDQGKPEQAVNAVLKLITRDQVIAVLGEVASSRSLAAGKICQQYKVPMISPTSTNPKVTETGDYIFRTCFIDPFQGSVMAKFAVNTLKAKTAAILTDHKQDYSVGLSQFFKETFISLGGKIVSEEAYQSDDKDFKPQLTNIRVSKPDVIFVPGYYTECALISRQARELGIMQPLLGGDGWDSDVTLKSGGSAVEGVYFSNHYHQDDPRPEVQNFVTKFKQKYNEVPDAMAVTAYDAANILFAAIKNANSLDRKAIRDQIANTTDFKGVTGTFSIDENRNAKKGIVVLKIENGKYNFVEFIQP